MSDTCIHEVYNFDIGPMAYSDTNVRIFSFSATCRDCGEKARFLGLGHHLSLSQPSLSPDGTTLMIPAVGEYDEVEHERRLPS